MQPLSDTAVMPVRVAPTNMLDASVERVIAQGRVVLCLISVLVFQIGLAPNDPYAPTISVVALAYTIYAIGMALLMRRWHPSLTAQIAIHLIDIGVTATISIIVTSPANPLVAFFTFVLLAATLRWNWYGVIGTASVLALILGPNLSIHYMDRQAFTQLFPQVIFLGMAGAMLAYVSAYLDHSRKRLANLARWPEHDTPTQQEPVIANTLAHASSILGTPRILVLWEETEEPDINVDLWTPDGDRHSRELFEHPWPFVSASLSQLVFATDDIERSTVLLPEGSVRTTMPVIDPQFSSRFQIRSFATAPFSKEGFYGRIFILDRESWSRDLLTLTEIVASRVAMEIERQLLQIHGEQSTLLQERVRLLRDLHDGVLQTLAATALQVKLLSDSPTESVTSRTAIIKDLLTKEQKRIRDFLQEHQTNASAKTRIPLSGFSHECLSLAAKEWNCSTSLDVIPPDSTAPRSLMDQLSFIFREAIANAVRHGNASRVDVNITTTHEHLLITIRDNGRGFPQYRDCDQSRSAKPLPVTLGSLSERVSVLGGSILIHSSSAGTTLEIQLGLL